MERIEQDETIDLQKLFAIIADRKKLFGKIISLILPLDFSTKLLLISSYLFLRL